MAIVNAKATLFQDINNLRTIILAVTAAFIFIGLGVGIFIAREIKRPEKLLLQFSM